MHSQNPRYLGVHQGILWFLTPCFEDMSMPCHPGEVLTLSWRSATHSSNEATEVTKTDMTSNCVGF